MLGWRYGFSSPSSVLFVKWSMQRNVGDPPSPGLVPPCSSSSHPCLILPHPVVLITASKCSSTLFSASGGGVYREPQLHTKAGEMVMVEQKSQGTPGQIGPLRTLCGAGLVWPSFRVLISLTTYLAIALSVSFVERCEEIAM